MGKISPPKERRDELKRLTGLEVPNLMTKLQGEKTGRCLGSAAHVVAGAADTLVTCCSPIGSMVLRHDAILE